MGTLGMPTLEFEFRQKATTAIDRSSRGVVLLLLKDMVRTQVVTAYNSLAEVVKEDWSSQNYKYFQYAFKGKPSKVLAVRAVVKEEAVDVASSIQLFNNLRFDYFAYPECTAEDAEVLASFFDVQKKTKYKKWKAVLPNHAADSYAVVNFAAEGISIVWDSASEVEEVSTADYTARIAGILAGVSVEQSSTYYVLDEIVDVKQVEDPDAAIGAGKLIIVYDGEKFKIGRGVTSLQTISDTIPEDFKKIKIVESADIIRTDIIDTYETYYLGKKNNSYDNKQMFIGAVNTYLKAAAGTLIDPDSPYTVAIDAEAQRDYLLTHGKTEDEVAAMTETELLSANTGSFFALAGSMKLLDTMEDFKFTINL